MEHFTIDSSQWISLHFVGAYRCSSLVSYIQSYKFIYFQNTICLLRLYFSIIHSSSLFILQLLHIQTTYTYSTTIWNIQNRLFLIWTSHQLAGLLTKPLSSNHCAAQVLWTIWLRWFMDQLMYSTAPDSPNTLLKIGDFAKK